MPRILAIDDEHKILDILTFYLKEAGFEVEAFITPKGRMTVSAFAQTRFLWSVGDRDVDFGDDAGVISFSYRRQGSSLRGGVGVRLGWQGGSAD